MKRALIFVLLVASPALAQTARETRAVPTQRIDFTDDDLVRGEFLRGGDPIIISAQARGFGTLIRVRSHFLPEMLKSAENF